MPSPSTQLTHTHTQTRTHCVNLSPCSTFTFHMFDLGTQFGGLFMYKRACCLKCRTGMALLLLSAYYLLDGASSWQVHYHPPYTDKEMEVQNSRVTCFQVTQLPGQEASTWTLGPSDFETWALNLPATISRTPAVCALPPPACSAAFTFAIPAKPCDYYVLKMHFGKWNNV